MTLLSILVTVYNREKFLGPCLDSILASKAVDFELVITDDASTDGSWDIASGYATRDDRIRVFRNPSNLGDYQNRNHAASFANGKYLKYVDADDIVYPHALAVMVEAMERFPAAALGISWNVIDPPTPFPFELSPQAVYLAHFLGRSPLGAGPSGAIIRRAAFEQVGGFSGEQFVGDTDLWLRLAARWPTVSLPPALVWWRRHEGQEMAAELARPEVATRRFLLAREHLRCWASFSPEERAQAELRHRRHHARRLLAQAPYNPLGTIQSIRAAGLSVRDLWRGLRSYG